MDETLFPYAFQQGSHGRKHPPAVPTDYAGLAAYLDGHLEAEEKALNSYQRLVDDRPADIISYLIGAILKDEARHHELFAEISNSLKSKIRWEDVTPRVPAMTAHLEDRDALLQATEELLEVEQEDAKELARLRKAWEKVGGEFSFWALLVEGAELDTEKHIRWLRYLRRLVTEIEP
jgi:rubrerythrin